MKSKENIKEFYDQATIRKLHGFVNTNTRVEYAYQGLRKVLDFIKPKRVLEIGCGIGEICYRLSSALPESKICGFDISEQSVKIASDLFISPNLSFYRADSVQEFKLPSKEKFDLIYLMDVYEHIPLEEREGLYKFVSERISENGFVFFSCPTPQHLDYLRVNHPTEIQPVDENIYLDDLMKFSKQTKLKLISYKEVSVWSAGDYFHVVFSNFLNMQRFSDFKEDNKIVTVGLKNEILKKLKKTKHLSEQVNLTIIDKQNLIKKKLGNDILDKVKAFKF